MAHFYDNCGRWNSTPIDDAYRVMRRGGHQHQSQHRHQHQERHQVAYSSDSCNSSASAGFHRRAAHLLDFTDDSCGASASTDTTGSGFDRRFEAFRRPLLESNQRQLSVLRKKQQQQHQQQQQQLHQQHRRRASHCSTSSGENFNSATSSRSVDQRPEKQSGIFWPPPHSEQYIDRKGRRKVITSMPHAPYESLARSPHLYRSSSPGLLPSGANSPANSPAPPPRQHQHHPVAMAKQELPECDFENQSSSPAELIYAEIHKIDERDNAANKARRALRSRKRVCFRDQRDEQSLSAIHEISPVVPSTSVPVPSTCDKAPPQQRPLPPMPDLLSDHDSSAMVHRGGINADRCGEHEQRPALPMVPPPRRPPSVYNASPFKSPRGRMPKTNPHFTLPRSFGRSMLNGVGQSANGVEGACQPHPSTDSGSGSGAGEQRAASSLSIMRQIEDDFLMDGDKAARGNAAGNRPVSMNLEQRRNMQMLSPPPLTVRSMSHWDRAPSIASSSQHTATSASEDGTHIQRTLRAIKQFGIRGELYISASVRKGMLTVNIDEARRLQLGPSSDSSHSTNPQDSHCGGDGNSTGQPLPNVQCNSYVRFSLMPNNDRRTLCRTALMPRSNEPVYDQSFTIELLPEDYDQRLVISCWHKDFNTWQSIPLGCMAFKVRSLAKGKAGSAVGGSTSRAHSNMPATSQTVLVAQPPSKWPAKVNKAVDQLAGTSSEEDENEIRDQFDVNLPISSQRPLPPPLRRQVDSLTLASHSIDIDTGGAASMRRVRSFVDPANAAVSVDAGVGVAPGLGLQLGLRTHSSAAGTSSVGSRQKDGMIQTRKISAIEPRSRNKLFNVAIPKKFSFGGLRKKSGGTESNGSSSTNDVNNGKIPPREEVEKWAKSFENLVRNDHGVTLFRSFLQREFSEENIDFWIAVQEFRTAAAAGDSDAELARRAHAIHDEFVMVQAPKEVNLDADTRSATEAALRSPHVSMFDGALVKIEHLMEKDSFPRFLKSELYADVLAACKK